MMRREIATHGDEVVGLEKAVEEPHHGPQSEEQRQRKRHVLHTLRSDHFPLQMYVHNKANLYST